jgi:hypothetical protein
LALAALLHLLRQEVLEDHQYLMPLVLGQARDVLLPLAEVVAQ